MRTYTSFGLSALIALLLLSCRQEKQEENTTPEVKTTFCLDSTFKATLKFAPVTLQSVIEYIPMTGTVEANPDKVYHFVSSVDGRIANTYFSLGDVVKKGQLLADIYSAQLTEWNTKQSTQAEKIAIAERNLKSVESMFEDGISSEKKLIKAQSQLNIEKSKLEKVNTNLRMFSASEDKDVFQIKAAASGIITDKNINPGIQINGGGEPLFTISDLSQVWVMLNVYASNLALVRQGMEVDITTLSYPDQVFKGHIASITPVFDAESKVVKARVQLDNSDLLLKPGMLVDVHARKERNMTALAVNTSALIFDNNQYFLIVYQDDCHIAARKVDMLSRSGPITYISGGIAEQEIIVTRNQLLIYEKLKNL